MNLGKMIAVRTGKTLYRDGETVIKLFNENYSKADILNEALNQARVEETGLRIPKIHGVNMIDGKWAILLEYVEGKTLSQIMKENPDKQAEYLSLLVEIQLSIQNCGCTLLTKQKDKMDRQISEAELPATTRYDLRCRLQEMPRHNKLCHGDLCPSNIIMTEDGTPCIIDWSHATQGNASSDAAHSYLVLCRDWGEDVANQYLDLFCEKSHIANEYVIKWLPLVAAARLNKATPAEENRLMTWVNAEV